MIGHCIWSVTRFAGIPPERILVADDAANPMLKVDRDKLTSLGVKVIETTFDRNRNLNGYPCVFGVLDVMDDAAEELGATHVLKIDPDTMLFSPEIVDRLDGGAVGSIGGAVGEVPNKLFYGMSYILRSDIIKRALDFVSKSTSEKLTAILDGNHRLPEDYTISSICSIISPSTHVTIPFTSGRGFHCSWPYGRKDLPPLQAITSFSSIHFGQWHQINGSTPSRKRSFAGSVMGGCRKLLEEWDSNNSKTRKCMTISFGGFGPVPEARQPASFTSGFNSTFLYDLLPLSGTGAPLLSAWVDQEFEGTNNEGVDWTDSRGESHQEQVEVHIYRSAWAEPGFFTKPSPSWYKGGMCALVLFKVDSQDVRLIFHEFNRTRTGTPTLRDKAGRTIMITQTEEKPWPAEEVAEKQGA